jgi:DHA2 family multidrug resistance protein
MSDGVPDSQPDGSEWRPTANPWAIAMSVMLATFMEVLDTTIVAVSLPHMAGGLAATNEEATWVLTSYLVANAIVLPASGWFSLRFGRRRFLLWCTAMFTVASVLCGIAPAMTALVIARAIQGAGGGAMQPLAQAILLESFPPAKRGMAMAVFGLGVVVAPIVGPVLGGWITDNYSWRWVFYINIPIGILALLLMRRTVEDPPYIANAKPGKIDAMGFAFLTLWLATLQIVLDKGQDEDWFASAWIRGLAAISVTAMLFFVVRELRAKEPIANLRVFLNWNFATGTIMTALLSAVMYSTVTNLPLFLQTLMGYTAAITGLAVSPRGIGALVGLPLVGFLVSIVDGRWLIVVGACLLAAANLMFAHVNLEIAMSNIVLPNVIIGFSMAFIFVPLMTLALARLRNDQIGNATGIFNLMRNLGGSIGIAATTTYLTRSAQRHQAILVGHLTPYDPVYSRYIASLQAGLTPLTGGPQAQQQAPGVLYQILNQQAHLCAFVDNFYWIALLVLFCVPAALLMRKVISHADIPVH